MFQFSLRNLLIAVASFAFGAAALVNANSWWLAITWSTSLFSLAAALLLAVYRREEKRAFWSGFAIFGALYVLLLMYSIQPVSSSNSSVLCLLPLSYFNLLTTKLSNWSYSRLPAALTTEYLPGPGPGAPGSGSMPGMPGMGGMPGGGVGGPPGGGMGAPFGMMPGMAGGMGSSGMGPSGGGMPAMALNPRFVSQQIYLEVSHALWTLLIAMLGGALARWLHKTRGSLASRAEVAGTDTDRS